MCLIFVVIYALTIFSGVTTYDCLKDNDQFACKFGIFTPYRHVANYNESHPEYPGCTEKKIWLMVRHGTRYPKDKVIRAMRAYLPELQTKIINHFDAQSSKLSTDVIERLKKWKFNLDTSYSMVLANEGENELVDLAERMQARFPILFPVNYDKELYKFKFTATQRTERSAKSFVLGLFGQHESSKVSFPKPESKDPILRFYERCERWHVEIRNNEKRLVEKNLFVNSEIFQNVLFEMSRRAGFQLDYDLAYLIFEICGFESAWYPNSSSPWCDLLTLNDVKVFEYMNDLKYYWKDGYGYRLTYEQACPALLDVFSFFKSSNKSLVTAYFTHSGTILKMLSKLGIAKDESLLTHKSYELYKDSRKWKVGLIDAFASNIAFILYDCKYQGQSVLFLHQERPVQLPGCPDKMPCPISILKNKYPDIEEECPFDDMCSIKE